MLSDKINNINFVENTPSRDAGSKYTVTHLHTSKYLYRNIQVALHFGCFCNRDFFLLEYKHTCVFVPTQRKSLVQSVLQHRENPPWKNMQSAKQCE